MFTVNEIMANNINNNKLDSKTNCTSVQEIILKYLKMSVSTKMCHKQDFNTLGISWCLKKGLIKKKTFQKQLCTTLFYLKNMWGNKTASQAWFVE